MESRTVSLSIAALLLSMLTGRPLSAKDSISLGTGMGIAGANGSMVAVYLSNDHDVAGIQFALQDDMNMIEIDTVYTTPRTRGFTAMVHRNQVILFNLEGKSIAPGAEPVLELILKVSHQAQMGADTLRYMGDPILVSPEGKQMDSVLFLGGIFYISSMTDVEQRNAIPESYALEQNFPNPFNMATTIRYSVQEPGLVQIKIYDMLGQEVTTLVDAFMPAGYHEIHYRGDELASGVYFFQLRVNNYSQTRKMMIMK